ncbi:hypothetical protein HWV62_28445 [Athelia sp. TMB]|nr:hypothetical protein HWV62_28445 [Athelia sp. TMB]
MVNHQSRQQLEDQIQSHGFLFLDDYMDNILAQAKRDPLIDLVKTPGRKKAAPKKTRAAVAAANAKSVVISIENTEYSKENKVQLNTFQKALMRAKDDDNHSGTLPPRVQLAEQSTNVSLLENSRALSIVENLDWEEERTVENILSSPPPPRAESLPVEEAMEQIHSPVPPQPDLNNDLSVIAEDDEGMERSMRLVLQDPGAANIPTSDSVPTPTVETALDLEEEQDNTQSMDITASSSGRTFHSIPLDSPEARRSSTRPTSDSDYATAPLPQLLPSQIMPTYTEVMPVSLPQVPTSVSTPHVVEVSAKDSPPTQFPSLPAPSPLRKSMRAPPREPSMNVGMPVPPLPSVANGVGPGKRTSWLMKAREVKAMEAPGNRTSTVALASGMPVGLKRKSGDMLASTVPGMASMLAQDEEEHRRKAAKKSEGDPTVSKEKIKLVKEVKDNHPTAALPQHLPTPSVQSPVEEIGAHTTIDGDTISLPAVEAEGIMDRLKRTVEGLGRPGKSMGKSLGGPAAAAALAEARAAKVAAHARIAERDGLSNTADVVVALEETHVVALTTKAEVSKVKLTKETKERKLSVSDLVSAFEDGSKGRVKEEAKNFKPVRSSTLSKNGANESTSTTPPNSPPATQNSSFVLPLGPVFNKQPEDSMTWSTLPTESQRDTRSTQNVTGNTGDSRKEGELTQDREIDELDDDLMVGEDDLQDSDLEDILAAGQSTVSLVKGKAVERSQSQMSMASTSDSSQSQAGWVSQATKLVSSVLGGSKSKKPQVPSLQRAALAAKKEQEEKDKKAARAKETETRRQLALQKKAEEDKAKAQEEERKMKDEREKRKRERDETTDKKPLKTTAKKEEDTSKKRKTTVEAEKKPVETKKPPSKDVAPSRMPQPAAPSAPKSIAPAKSGFKPSTSNQVLASSAVFNVQPSSGSAPVKPADVKPPKPSAAAPASSIKGKGKAKMPEDDLAQPSHQLKDQMAARAKLQLQAAKQIPESTEDIELPDINSEYSDSEDEDRPRTFDPPNWAQSPELRQQLERQSRVNPDDIFGPVKPLRMEEVFRTRQSRFRARTSSANWTGTDRLTVEEEREYVRRMGFR